MDLIPPRASAPRSRHRFRTAAVAPLAGLALVAALTGCSGGDSTSDASTTSAGEVAPAPAGAAPDAGSSGDSGVASLAGGAGDTGDTDDAGGAKVASSADLAARDTATPPSVISTGSVSLRADDVAAARLRVRRVVEGQQGEVTQQETATGKDGEARTATLTARVPAARFADVVAALEDLGDGVRLVDSSTSSEDVTSQVVDTVARVRAQQRSVARIEALMARARTIGEVISIEGQLAQRQADLDALVSQQKYLADQTAMSTISVNIDQRRAGSGDRDRDGFAGGLAAGWDAFVGGAGGALTALGFALPWLALLAVVGAPVVAWRRRRRVGPAPATTP